MEKSKSSRMGEKAVLPLILVMSIPAMMSMLVQALYNIVDSYFVAMVSESALTAVSLVFPIQNLLIGVAVGTGVGINSLISRRLGEDKLEEASSAATHGIVLAVISTAVFAIIGLFFSRAFFEAFTDDPAIVEMGASYMRVVCIGSIGIFASVNIEKVLQATGNMIQPMKIQLIGAIVNLILDPIFIFGLFGMPKLGVTGAALATIIGQIAAALYAVYAISQKDQYVKVKLKGFRFKSKSIKDIYSVGFPAIVMQSVGSVMVVGINTILIGYSYTAVAFFGIYFKLQSFVFMPVFGLNQGILPIIGYNYGARKQKRVTETVKWAIVIAVTIMAAGTALFWIFPAQLLGIFKASDEMLELGVPALRVISLSFIPAGIGIALMAAFQALGRGFSSLFVSTLRQMIVILPVSYLLSEIFGKLNMIWYAFPFAELFALTASLIIYRGIYKKVLLPMDNHKK